MTLSESLQQQSIYIILLVIFIIVLVLIYKVGEKSVLEKDLEKNLKKFNENNKFQLFISNMDNNTTFENIRLLGSFNSFNIKSYSNSQAYLSDNYNILKNILTTSSCLDFQVFLHNNELIVASSNNNKSSMYKESINYISLYKVFNNIKKYSNENEIGSIIILHIRVMSKNYRAYDKLLKLYKDIFDINPESISNLTNRQQIHYETYNNIKNAKILLFLKPIDNLFEYINNLDQYFKYINALTIDYNSNITTKDNIDILLDKFNKINKEILKNKIAIIYNNHNDAKQDKNNNNYIKIYMPNINNPNDIIDLKLNDENYFNIILLKYQYINKDSNKSNVQDILNYFKTNGDKYYKIKSI